MDFCVCGRVTARILRSSSHTLSSSILPNTVNEQYIWFSYTCGGPIDGGCQTDRNYTWPSSGTLVIDPSVQGADWAFPGGRNLTAGCYKVLLNREMKFISPPPYPTICAPWGEALTFTVPDLSTSPPTTTPLTSDVNPEVVLRSGSSSYQFSLFALLVPLLAINFGNYW